MMTKVMLAARRTSAAGAAFAHEAQQAVDIIQPTLDAALDGSHGCIAVLDDSQQGGPISLHHEIFLQSIAYLQEQFLVRKHGHLLSISCSFLLLKNDLITDLLQLDTKTLSVCPFLGAPMPVQGLSEVEMTSAELAAESMQQLEGNLCTLHQQQQQEQLRQGGGEAAADGSCTLYTLSITQKVDGGMLRYAHLQFLLLGGAMEPSINPSSMLPPFSSRSQVQPSSSLLLSDASRSSFARDIASFWTVLEELNSGAAFISYSSSSLTLLLKASLARASKFSLLSSAYPTLLPNLRRRAEEEEGLGNGWGGDGGAGNGGSNRRSSMQTPRGVLLVLSRDDLFPQSVAGPSSSFVDSRGVQNSSPSAMVMVPHAYQVERDRSEGDRTRRQREEARARRDALALKESEMRLKKEQDEKAWLRERLVAAEREVGRRATDMAMKLFDGLKETVEREVKRLKAANAAELATQAASFKEEILELKQAEVDRLKKEVEEHKGSLVGILNNCAICYKVISVPCVCVPCGHMSTCWDCMQEVEKTTKKCPMCRAKYGSVIKVYRA